MGGWWPDPPDGRVDERCTDFDDSLEVILTAEFVTSCTFISYGKQVSNHIKGNAITTGIFHNAVCTKMTNIFLLSE